MEIIHFTLDKMPQPEPGLSLALGNFDAMHKGHHHLFLATSFGARTISAALIFATPFIKPPYLCSSEDKERYARGSRLDRLYILDNDESLFALTPEEFIERVLLPLGTERVVVGDDFRFGKGALGDAETLRKHFEVEVIKMLEFKGKKISSSSIKEDILKGELSEMEATLGRVYEVRGKVVKGFQNGRLIDYPTINLAFSFPYALPRVGVYLGIAYVSGIARMAIINVGSNPTLGLLQKPIVEAHLLDFDDDAYGKTVYLAFYTFLREEKKFASMDELKRQLDEDSLDCREYFGR